MKKKNHVRARFSTIVVLCIPAILLCAAPCGAETVFSGETLNVGTGYVDVQINDYLLVLGTVNLYPGAYVDYGIYAFDGSALNIYAGELGADSFIMLMGSASIAVVTVYGTDFAVDGELLDLSATQFTVESSNGVVLTGVYENGAPISLKFVSFKGKSINVVTLGTTNVEIDIKPGGNPNNINLRSKGVVPVAVLTIGGFKASDIDPETVEFAGAKPVRWKLEDVDEDGDPDMLFHFKTQDLVDLDENSTEATLTATLIGTMTSTMTSDTTAGEVIQGTDEVCIKSGKKKK